MDPNPHGTDSPTPAALATGPRALLNPDTVVRLAIEVADREGLAAVSFRRLAADLHVTPMSLYRHVRDKDDLLDRMTDAIMAELALSVDPAADWTDQLRQVLHAVHRVALAHPVCPQLVAGRPFLSQQADRATEALLAILERAGFGMELSADITRQLMLLSLGPALLPSIWAPQSDPDAARRIRVHLAELPPGEFPRVLKAGGALLNRVDPERTRKLGIDLLIAGVESLLETRKPHKKRKKK